jgi:hypothetical protein
MAEDENEAAFVDLGRDLYARFPSATASLSIGARNARMLDVRLNQRMFVLEQRPEQGYGVGEVTEDHGFNMGYAQTFEDFEQAKECLLAMLHAAHEKR